MLLRYMFSRKNDFSISPANIIRVIEGVRYLAKQQGGSSMLENYRLLGKRTAIVGGIVLVAVPTVTAIGVRVISRKIKKKRDEKRYAKKKIVSRLGHKNNEIDKSSLSTYMPNTFYIRCGKRICDIAVSVAALPLVLGIIGICGILIKKEDKGPIFYNAPRVGINGTEFTMYKLRSMKVDSPDLVMEDGSTYNGADDPRMTQVGALMRRTSLDEIPQFLNVLRGDMSVVGPRPDLKREVELYEGEEILKLAVKPGITGYAAVYGRNSLPWKKRLELDVYYIKHFSFFTDLKIFFKTFASVLGQEGIYVKEDSGHALPQKAVSSDK